MDRRYYDFPVVYSTDRESQESSSMESLSQSSGGTDETGEGGAASLTGGYEYDFVENPPEDMSCSICLLVLRDPVLTSCCGNHFCQSCFDRIQVEGNPCPLCQTPKTKFQVMLDKFFQRKVKELKIKCPNSEHGCEWVGELGDVEKHIDTPSGCEYVEVLCGYSCGNLIQRRNLAEHKTDYCLLRPFSCEYCQFHRTYKFITEFHWPVCEKYPVECPSKCGIGTIERKHLDKHVQEECPLTVVDCEFKNVGCSVRLPRKDMPWHKNDYSRLHLFMVMWLLVDVLRNFVDHRREILDHLQFGSAAASPSSVTSPHLPQYPPIELQQSTPVPVPPVEFIMDSFPGHMAADDRWLGEPFYTHRRGYMMCLSVYANGAGKAKGSHISVFANIMAGEFDDDLNWPFRGSIDIKLLNVGLETDDTLKFTSKSPPWTSKRVLKGKKNNVGQGNMYFISHSAVSCFKPKFLKFRVCSVRISC